jgi:hypothetical protein
LLRRFLLPILTAAYGLHLPVPARAAAITAEEAKALDPDKVRAAKKFYECMFKENPANAAAKARAELMDKILELQGAN